MSTINTEHNSTLYKFWGQYLSHISPTVPNTPQSSSTLSSIYPQEAGCHRHGAFTHLSAWFCTINSNHSDSNPNAASSKVYELLYQVKNFVRQTHFTLDCSFVVLTTVCNYKIGWCLSAQLRLSIRRSKCYASGTLWRHNKHLRNEWSLLINTAMAQVFLNILLLIYLIVNGSLMHMKHNSKRWGKEVNKGGWHHQDSGTGQSWCCASSKKEQLTSTQEQDTTEGIKECGVGSIPVHLRDRDRLH